MNNTILDPEVEKLKSLRDSLPSEPSHERAFFAGQQWVSEETHQIELAKQRSELLDLVERDVIENKKYASKLRNKQRQKLQVLRDEV